MFNLQAWFEVSTNAESDSSRDENITNGNTFVISESSHSGMMTG